MKYNAHINADDDLSIAFHIDFETQQEAEAWCRGFIDSINYEGVPYQEVYWWTVYDENMEPVSSWSTDEGYYAYSSRA